jgi:hypothetical protein
MVRDGRDVMVSYYYYNLFNGRFDQRSVEITRKKLKFDDFHDIKSNLPKFIEYSFTRKDYPRFSWSEFVNTWIDKDVAIIKYENLLQDPVREMGKALYKVCRVDIHEDRLGEIAQKYSFKNLAGRNPGDQNIHSFLRQGIAGGWKNRFTTEAKQVFNKFGGRELIKLGYEVDESWV